MKISILFSLISVALVGCKGSDLPTKPNDLSFDGIYANNEAVMLVDTTLTHGAIVANGSHILSFDGFTKNDESMTFKRTHLGLKNGDYEYSAYSTMSALFSNNNVQTIANLSTIGTMFTYDLSKQPRSLPLSELVGRHETAAGQITEINADGTFTSYANTLGCIYNGTLKMTKGIYYSSTVAVTDCAKSGTYNGYFFTVNKSNQTKLLAIYRGETNESYIVWGETPITK